MSTGKKPLMYEKNLTEDFRLRLSEEDMSFLIRTAEERDLSVSSLVRSIIGDYRRASLMYDFMRKALKKEEEMSDGDTETDINDKL